MRVVTVNYSFWDWHGQNFKNAQEELPVFDKAVSALVEDLHERGLDKDVHRGRLGRVRPHAEDQQRRRPRSLAARVLRTAGRRRHADRPGRSARPTAWAAKPANGRSRSKKSTPRSTTTWASTCSAPRLFDFRGRPQYLVDPDVKPIAELV